jgi:putative DNA primase/helicase
VSGTFVPDPSWPTITELAIEAWGQPNRALSSPAELRFGANGSKALRVVEMVWRDHEAGTGGGYVPMWHLARGTSTPLPPRGGVRTAPKTNGAHPPPGAGETAGGATGADLAQDRKPDPPRIPPWENISRVYRYLDAAGHLVLEVIRTVTGNPKFMQRRPDGTLRDGGIKWKWSVRDIPRDTRPLYLLPALLKSSAATVFICEGEKDADNLAALGLTATTCIGGAGKWRAAYNGFFAGRDVVILPDNDPQARHQKTKEPLWHPDGRPVLPGQDHAAAVAQALTGVAWSVKVLMLPGLGPKGDVSDWLAAGGTVEALMALVRETPTWEPPEAPQPPPPGDGGDGGGGDDPPPPDDAGEEPPDDWDGIPPPMIAAGELITEQFAMRLFVTANHEALRFNHASGQWLVWGEHRWRPDERKLAFYWALNLCRQLAGETRGRDPTKARLVIEKRTFSGAVELGARTIPPISTAQGDWDENRMLLGTPGGVVDLATGELRPGRREDMISRATNVTPGVTPDCPTWIGFLDYAMHGDEHLVRFIQRYFGYALTGLTNEEIFLFLFGLAGAGKGTLIETIVHIMGDYAGSTPMEVFTGQTWSPTEYYRASMAGLRLIVANEPERDAFWAEAFIKEVTGGDTLSGRHPMGRPFRFKPSHKMALQGNHLPRLRGRSTGMERRLRILPFTRKPEEPDRHLKAKLLAEGPAILRWLIEGCLAWQKIGLDPPQAVRVAGQTYFEGQDPFARWVEEWCILDPQAEMEPARLRASFNVWAQRNGEETMTGNAFAEAIEQYEPLPPAKRLKRTKNNGKRLVVGLRLNPPALYENEGG